MFTRHQAIRGVLSSCRASFAPLSVSSLGQFYIIQWFFTLVYASYCIHFLVTCSFYLECGSRIIAFYGQLIRRYILSWCSVNILFLFLILAMKILCHAMYVRRFVLSSTSVFSMVELSACFIFKEISSQSVVSNIWKLLTWMFYFVTSFWICFATSCSFW